MVSGFLDAVRQEFIDIIAWDDPAPTDVVYRYPRQDAEIKHGAQLIVRPGQAAVFVDQGRIADVFGPGRHVLQTQNLPILSTLRGWEYGFDSPFKADVLFLQTIQFPAGKWGTKTPILVTDAEFGAVRLRAFGMFVVALVEPRRVIEQLAGSGDSMAIDELNDRFRDTIAAALNARLGVPGRRLTEIAVTLPALARDRQQVLQPQFEALGFRLEQLTIESVTLPDVVTAAVDRQAAVRVAGGIAGYTQIQSADAIKVAAEQGAAGGMLGLGAGVLLQQQLAGGLARARAASASPPPLPAAREVAWRVARPGADRPLDGEQDLPVATVRQLIMERRVVGSDVAWTVGAGAWQPLETVPAFADLFQPPPLPVPGRRDG